MSDSDTEYEPDNSLPKWNATDFAEISTQAHFDQHPGDRVNSVQQAIETLSSIDVESVIQDTSSHNDIQAASSMILTFINDFIVSDVFLDEAPHDILHSFSLILNVSFIILLLEYRRVFHSIAVQQTPLGTAGSSVICWVDVILSQLATAVVSGPSTPDQPEFPGLRKQREDETLRAAAQLPYEWNNVLGVISSNTASPAASRLALRLAFAVYVVGSQISKETVLSNDDSNHLRAIFDVYVHRISAPQLVDAGVSTLTPGSEIHFQERLSWAMSLALFSEVELSSPKSKESISFRPHTSAILMHCIQHVLHASENDLKSGATFPIVNLDLPQRLLFCWGQTTYWSWNNWDDERVVGSDSLTVLTATWLYHIQHAETDLCWDDVIRSLITRDPDVTSTAIAMLLRRLVQNMTTYLVNEIDKPTIVVLYRSIWMATQLLDHCVNWPVSTSPELIRCLLGLFALAHGIEYEENVNDLILRGLTPHSGESFRSALLSVQEDVRINFAMKIDLAISNVTRSLLDNQQDRPDLTSARQMLMFLAIMWNSDSSGCFHKQTISSFLSSTIDWISAQKSTNFTLQNSLITALTCLENIKSCSMSTIVNKLWDDDTIWTLAFSSNPTDLPTSSAFANYIKSTAKHRKCDTLCFADAWDYLRDSLLLILTHHFLGDEEPLALIVVESICHALTTLLRFGDSKARNFIISSPWTMSLCASLQHAMGQVNQDDTYAVVLKERLSVHGLELKTRIARIVSPAHSNDEVLPSAAWSTSLMYCQIGSIGQFLLQVPRE